MGRVTAPEKEGPAMADVPSYDPAVHTLDDNPLVLLEMWCSCGMAHRQADPVSHCLPQIADFRAKHTGDGHGATTAKKALTEREARRQAGFRALGRQGDYEPKQWTAGAEAFDWSADTEGTD